MAGRQEGLLSPVEQEDQVVGEGGLLAGQHHPSHLEHDGTAGAIVTGTWTLDRCQVTLLTAHHVSTCGTLSKWQLRRRADLGPDGRGFGDIRATTFFRSV